jgi:hypothetical protein
MDNIKIFENLNKNNLNKSTIKSYFSRIKTLSEYFKDNGYKINNLFFIDNTNDIIKYINENIKNKASKISIYSALLYLLNYFKDNKNLISSNKLNEIIELYKNEISLNRNIITSLQTNNKSDKESDNWLSYNELVDIFNNNYDKYINIINMKQIIKIDEYYNIQNMVLLSFYILIEPVRSSEIATLKYQNYDKNIDNYIDIKNKILVFNQFKTSKSYKQNIIDLKDNIKLINLIKSFIIFKNKNKFNNDYLFNSNDNTVLDNSQITKRLNKIIGKNISSSMIRKIYLTDTYGHINDTMKKLNKSSKNMMNSVNVIQTNYIKN